MTFAPGTQLHLYLQWVNVCVALSHNCALNVKAVVAASNQYQVPSRGLLRDCEIFANIRLQVVSVSALYWSPGPNLKITMETARKRMEMTRPATETLLTRTLKLRSSQSMQEV